MPVETREWLFSSINSLCFRCCGSIHGFIVTVQRQIQFSIRSEAKELFDSTPLIKERVDQCRNALINTCLFLSILHPREQLNCFLLMTQIWGKFSSQSQQVMSCIFCLQDAALWKNIKCGKIK